MEKEEDYTVSTRTRRSTLKRRQTVTWETLADAHAAGQSPSTALVTANQKGIESTKTFSRIKTLEKFAPGRGEAKQNPGAADQKPIEGHERVCRICLCEEDDTEDPIVAPCKCQGTMREVHVKCFKKWLAKQISVKDSKNMYSIFWDQLKCELCGEEVESKFSVTFEIK